MNSNHRKTLAEIFALPVSGNLEWRKMEALFAALGAEIIEGSGSRVSFILNGEKADFHRPHPGKEAKRYQLKKRQRFSDKNWSCPMNTINYKGYTAAIEFDPDDNIFVGNIIGIRDTVGFHGESVSELKAAFQEAVDFYLESCSKAGREPNKPFSGRLMVRVDALLHEKIAAAAVRTGKSLNKWVADTLEQAVPPCIH